jgi:ketosteroid isomerase-like protein
MYEAFEHFSPTMVEAIDCGPDRLISIDRVRGRGRGSGIDMEAHGAMLWTIRAGRIFHVKMFQTKEDALAAVGSGDEDPSTAADYN